MSVFVQEVLGLLKRNFVKTTLNPTDDYFQFVRKGVLSRARSSAGGFAPQGQSLAISAGSWLCSQTGPQGLGRFVSTVKDSGEAAGVIPMFWLKQGQCSWHALKDSLLTQDSADRVIYVGKAGAQTDASLKVTDKIYIPKLNDGADDAPGRISFVLPNPNPGGGGIAGELDSNVNFTFEEKTATSSKFTVGSGVSSVFGNSINTPVTAMRIFSHLQLNCEVYDVNNQKGVGPTGGNPSGQGGMLLRSRADGTVQWTVDSGGGGSIPDLQYGEIIIGYENPQPVAGSIVPAVASYASPLGTGNVNEVLTAGGPNGFPSWQPNPSIGGSGTLYQIAMFTPDGVTISNSLMSQDGDAFNGPKPLTVTNGIFDVANPGLAGNFVNTGTMKLLSVALDADVNKVLVLDPTSSEVKYRDADWVTGTGTLKRVPLWSPDPDNLESSLLQQSDVIQPGASGFGAQTLTNDGNLIQEGTVKLNDIGLIPDNTQDQVLVRDPVTNLVKYRSALSIGAGVLGWDVVDADTGVADWDVVLSNGFMNPDVTPTGAFRAIRPNNVTNAQEGYFVFVAGANDIPKDYLLFTGVNGSSANTVRTTWNGNIATNFVYTPSTLDSTGQYWGQDVAVKFHYILRIDPQGNQVIWWDACCEIKPNNECPISYDTNFITDEDTTISGLSLPSTDANPTQSLTWIIVSPPNPAHGTLTQVGGNGPLTYNYTFTPVANFCGSGTFTWKTNDGICDSNIATTTYNIVCKCDSPQFAVSNGVGNACGAASSPPSFSGVIGSTYTWNGDYCDIDNPATDVTILVYYSINGGATWLAGFGPNTGTLTQDTSASTFVFNIPSVAAGSVLYKIEMCDTEAGCCSEYIFSLSAASAILGRYELQISSTTRDGSGRSRVPYAQNTNLGMFGAGSGPYNCNGAFYGENWNTYMEQTRPSSQAGGGGYVASISTLGGGNGYADVCNFGTCLLTTGPAPTTPVAPSNGTDLSLFFFPENVLTMGTGGTGYSSINIPTTGQSTGTGGTQPGGGTGMTVTFTDTNGVIDAGSLKTARAGSGYAIGDTGFIGGNGIGVDATYTITAVRAVPPTVNFVTIVIVCPGQDWVVGDKFIFSGGSNDVEGEITQLTTLPPGGKPLWGNWGEVKGKILTDRSTVPTNMNTSGIPNNTSVEGITASGGTYGGIAGGATFQLVNMVAELPNPDPGSREIFVFADQIPANDLISVGQTIIFNAAKLDTAFAAHVSGGFNFTGDLICTIQEEDISYKPYATSSIAMAHVSSTEHACNEGAYKMTASITDGAGGRRTLTIGRFSVSNSRILNTAPNRTTKDNWDIPAGFINSTDGREWTRASNQSTWGQINYPYVIDKQYIDLTRRGLARNQVNSTYNNNSAYINQFNMMQNWYEAMVTSGVKRIPQADRDFIASNSVDGVVDFKLIGDTWVNTHHNDNMVKTVRGLIPGSGYSNGTYATTNNNFVSGNACNPPSTGGFDCKITITTSSGQVTGVTIAEGGSRYAVNDVLTIVGGSNDASVIVQSVGLGVDGTVKVTAVLAGGVIDTVITQTIGDPYATYQGDDKAGVGGYTQTVNVPAEFMATGGSGQDAQIRCNITGASVRNCGVVTARQRLSGTFTITNGGTGYQVNDILTISADHTWVAKTHSDAAQFRMFHKGNALIEGHVFNIIGGTNTGYPSGLNGTAFYTFDASGSSSGGIIFLFTNATGNVTKAIVPARAFPLSPRPAWTGQNFQIGDVLTINTSNGGSGTGNATITLLAADISNEQKEIFNGAPYNNTGSANDRAFIAGDGTAVRVNIFTGAVTIV